MSKKKKLPKKNSDSNLREKYNVSRTLIVQRSMLEQTVSLFTYYWKRKQEAVAYWYGKEIESEKTDIVVSLAVPRATHLGGHYYVPMEEASRMGMEMLESGMVCLAQIHTHPKGALFHSSYDDNNSISTRNDFLSLVVHDYGRVSIFDLSGFTVHVCYNNSWIILSDDQKHARIKIIDDLVDLRIEDLENDQEGLD